MQSQVQRAVAHPAIPGPKGWPLVGSTFTLIGQFQAQLLAAQQRYGDVVRFKTLLGDMILLSRPEHAAYVLQERVANFPKSASYDFLKVLLGNGLLTSEGDFWLRQRRLMQPAFHRQRLAGMVGAITDLTAAMLERWDHLRAQGRAFDVHTEMMELTLGIIGQTMFSTDLRKVARDVGPHFDQANAILNDRMNGISLPDWVPTPSNRRLKTAIATLDNLVYRLIAERRAGKQADDLLTMLLETRDADTGEGMSDQQIRDEVMTMLLAGHETTANTLTWTWYLLSQHPSVARRLQAEVREVLGDRQPTMADLANLPYTAMVVDEAMRILPPVWVIDRMARQDDQIDGYRIPAGSIVLLSPYVTHRHPGLWENPEGFDPERFSPERSANRHRLAFMPFGAGQRMCIGNQLALLESRLIVAMVAQRFRLDLVPGHAVIPEPLITLRPKFGVKVTAHHLS